MRYGTAIWKTLAVIQAVFLLFMFAVSCPAHDGDRSEPIAERSMTGGIQEMIDALPPEGGTVFIPAGFYELKASVALRSDIRLVGAGFDTILRHVDETKSSLAQDAAEDQNQVVVTDSAGFEIGMNVLMKNDNFNAGGQPMIKTITAITGNTITLDTNLEREVEKDPNGVVVNVFPVIKANGYEDGTTYSNVVIENLKIEGNRDNVGKYSFQQAGIVFVRTNHSTIRNVWIDRSNYEGISDQGIGDTWNTIADNLITDANGKGIHLGTINRHFTVSGNTILGSMSDGIFFCNVIQYGHVVGNTISGGHWHGVGGIDDSGASPDNYNVIEGNVITLNGLNGIQSANTEQNTILNNYIAGNSWLAPGDYAGLSLEDVTDFLVSGNQIVGNEGSGFSCSSSSVILVNNLIASNEGAGLEIADSTVSMNNLTIVGNLSLVPGGGLLSEDSVVTGSNCILWGNTPDQIHFELGSFPAISYSDVQGGFAGTGNVDSDPLFSGGPMGDYYLGQVAGGQIADSPCLNSGEGQAQNTCFIHDLETICLDLMSTSTIHGLDDGVADMGYHYAPQRYSTMTAALTCTPTAGTLPFTTSFDCTLTNQYSGLSRMGRAVLSVRLPGGSYITNWRSGTTVIGPGDNYNTSFSQTIPSLASLLGRTTLDLTIDDVTPPPYNQPPYPPSGDHDSDTCTLDGFAP